MNKITRNEADFSDLFEFAKNEYSVKWNDANDLFFRSEVLNYEKYNDFFLSELDSEATRPIADTSRAKRYKKAIDIIIAFMKHHKVDECRIYNG